MATASRIRSLSKPILARATTPRSTLATPQFRAFSSADSCNTSTKMTACTPKATQAPQRSGSGTGSVVSFPFAASPFAFGRFGNIPSLFKEFDDLFKPMFSSSFRDDPAWTQMFSRDFGNVDVVETKDGHIIKVDLPGMTKEDIKVSLDENNILTLSGERNRQDDKQDGNYRRMERSFGQFARSFRLPESSVKENIRADVKDGVLTITIPYTPEAPRRQALDIPITDGSDAGAAAGAAGGEGSGTPAAEFAATTKPVQ